MSTETATKVLELDDDPLGDVPLEPKVAFGLRAAMLAGNARELTDWDDWYLIPTLTTQSCSITFAASEPEDI